MNTQERIYPLTVIRDRYNGVYSGGKITAWNQDFYKIPEQIDGDDPSCMNFWDEFKQGEPVGLCGARVFVGFGNTIEEAINDLTVKMNIL